MKDKSHWIFIGLFIITMFPLAYGQPLSPVNPKWAEPRLPGEICLHWNSENYSSNYQVQIATDLSFNSIITDTSGITDTRCCLFITIEDTIYWRVRSVYGTGPGNWGKPGMFFIISPPNQVNCRLWLDASTLSYNQGDFVNQWTDLSNNHFHAIQNTPNKQAVFYKDYINHKDVVKFDGINDILVSPLTLTVSSFDLFIVSTLGNNIGSVYNGNSASNGYGFYRTNPAKYGSFFGGVTTSVFGDTLNSGFQILELTRQGSTSFFVNGISSGTPVTSIPNTPTGNTFIGGISNTESFSGFVAEVQIYNGQLSDSRRKEITNLLKYKYSPFVDLGDDITNSNLFCTQEIDAGEGFKSLLWSDGSTNRKIPISNGTYWVRAENYMGLISYDTIVVNITTPELVLNDSVLCQGDSIQLDSYIGDEFNYIWKDQNNDTLSNLPELTVNTGGNYSVVITDNAGCTSSETVIITEDNFASLIDLGNDTSLCSHQIIQLVESPPGITGYLWSTGDTNSAILVDNTGIYSVIVNNEHHCIAKDTIHVNIAGQSPEIDFITQNQCPFLPVTFSGENISNDSIVSWAWDFGDGDTSNQQNTVHIYTDPGEYHIQLRVLSQAGCPDHKTKSITVFPIPNASIYLDSCCVESLIDFIPSIKISSNDSIVSWEWDFGDGSYNNNQITSHSYSVPGDYAIYLTLVNKYGCALQTGDSLHVVGYSTGPMNFQCLYPLNNTFTTDTIQQFSWSKSFNAVLYKFQLSSDSLFNNSSPQITIFTKDTFITSQILLYPRIFWRITSYNLCYDSLLSAIHSLNPMYPSRIPGLKAWYTADRIVSEPGMKIEIWKDISGNQMDANNLSPAFQPIMGGNILNNKPVVTFDGISQYLAAPLPTNSIEYDIIAVSTLGNNFGPFYLGNTNSNGYGYYRMDTMAFGQLYGGVMVMKFGNINHRSFQVQELTRDATKTSMFSNNQLSGFSLNYIPNVPTQQCYIGGINNNQTFKGSIAEILVFDYSLSQDDRNTVFIYLHDKYCPPAVELGNDRISSYSLCPSRLGVDEGFYKTKWSTGDSTNVIEVTKNGRYSVTVTDLFNFTSTDSIYIEYPVKYLTDTTICLGDTAAFSVWTRSGYQYQWESAGLGIFSQDSAVKITKAGTYKVTILDSLGCYILDSVKVAVDSFPIQATLGGETASLCQGDYLALAGGAGDATTYLWNTGAAEPQTLILQAGLYSVTVSNSIGCTARDSIMVSLHGFVPVAGFAAADSVCLGESIQFTDLSHTAAQDTSATIVQWEWQFDDNSQAQVQHPSHLFQFPGYHDVTLIITTDSGCSGQTTLPVYLYPLPQADFLTTQGCTGTAVPFADHSYYPAGKAMLWDWDFGDPGSGSLNHSSDSSCQHFYNIPGDYLVRLIISSSNACMDTNYRMVHIQQSPGASFTFSNACEGDSTQFTNTSVLPPWALILNTEWDFGDGSPLSRESHPKHLFTQPGNYLVSMTLQTMQCKVTQSMMVAVDAKPQAMAGAFDLCENTEVTFQNLSTVSGGNIAGSTWELGTQGISHDFNADVSFNEPGTYTIRLSVVSDKGCYSDTVVYPIEVFPNPTAAFGYQTNQSLPGYEVMFSDSSSNDVADWLWHFGDGTTSSLQNPVHTYSGMGSYLVTLDVQTVHGCKDKTYQAIELLYSYVDIIVTKVGYKPDNNTWTFTADLLNGGTRLINSLDLKLSLNAVPTLTESWTGLLLPDSVMHYEFHSQVFQQQGLEVEYYCIEANSNQETGLMYLHNDQLCDAFDDSFRLFEPYPNPVGSTLYIPIVTDREISLTVNLYNNLGQQVYPVRKFEYLKGFHLLMVPTNKIQAGIYQIQIIIDGKIYSKKFVKSLNSDY